MIRVLARPTWSLALAVSLAATIAAAAQPTVSDNSDLPVEKSPMRLHGRLPPYYGQVVSEEQRMQIYRIQAEYQEQLESLQNRLKTLKQERDKKVASVLTEEQRKRVEEAAAEARAKRAARAKKKLFPSAENAAASPPAETSPAK